MLVDSNKKRAPTIPSQDGKNPLILIELCLYYHTILLMSTILLWQSTIDGICAARASVSQAAASGGDDKAVSAQQRA